MPNIIALKDNIVVSKVFGIDADAIALSDTAEVGDIYDPETGKFYKPEIKEPEPTPLNELGE